MPENPYLHDLVPHLARSGDYKPGEGDFLTLVLPGEMVRAKVLRASSEDSCIVQIESVPMARGHTYKKEDIVPARRGVDKLLGSERWEIVSERELQMAEATARFERAEIERVQREAAEKRAREAEAAAKAEEF